LREIIVVKKSGRRTPFDREKLARSVEIAMRKRPVDPERVDRMISGVVRQLESLGEPEIDSRRIGEMVIEGLRSLDAVAYVRFASVYRDFTEARDFNALIDELESGDDARGESDDA
jgi:transcriptional repressor NrdR